MVKSSHLRKLATTGWASPPAACRDVDHREHAKHQKACDCDDCSGTKYSAPVKAVWRCIERVRGALGVMPIEKVDAWEVVK